MASENISIFSGIHQLPRECYPPSESDEDESFVVLSNSLGPDNIKDSVLNVEPIETHSIRTSIDNVSHLLSTTFLSSPDDNDKKVTLEETHSVGIRVEDIQKKVDDLIKENTELKGKKIVLFINVNI